MEEIRTERLLLRPFTESDYDDLYEFLSQLKADEFEGYPGITYENGREYLRQRLGSEEFYAVVLPDPGKVIGNIYCGNRDYDAKEVGYIINRDYRGMGFAGEALSAVIENAFRQGSHRVFAECDPRNTASWKLLTIHVFKGVIEWREIQKRESWQKHWNCFHKTGMREQISRK